MTGAGCSSVNSHASIPACVYVCVCARALMHARTRGSAYVSVNARGKLSPHDARQVTWALGGGGCGGGAGVRTVCGLAGVEAARSFPAGSWCEAVWIGVSDSRPSCRLLPFVAVRVTGDSPPPELGESAGDLCCLGGRPDGGRPFVAPPADAGCGGSGGGCAGCCGCGCTATACCCGQPG